MKKDSLKGEVHDLEEKKGFIKKQKSGKKVKKATLKSEAAKLKKKPSKDEMKDRLMGKKKV